MYLNTIVPVVVEMEKFVHSGKNFNISEKNWFLFLNDTQGVKKVELFVINIRSTMISERKINDR